MRGNRRSRGDPLAHLTAVDGVVTQFLSDSEELIVLRDPICAAKRSGLNLSRVRRDGDVGDGGVFRFAGTMADHGGVPVFGREPNGVKSFSQCADLIHLNQDGIGDTLIDSFPEKIDVRDEEVVADQLNLIAQALS